ncbi:MAG TPA: non-homologous end-joining DNA ligase [Oculatellaceae cyanobacterium]
MLNEYRRKRDFKITPEPSGSKIGKRRTTELSFVIQKHAARRLHYDFRLEVNGVMVSWAVPKGPSLDPADKRLAVMTEDHPMEYASFEGLIPEGQYGAGEVIIWDKGTYAPRIDDQTILWSDLNAANKKMLDGLKKGKITFYLKGTKLEGEWTLARLHGKEKDWLLIKKKDRFARTGEDVTVLNESVVSGLTIEQMQEDGAEHIWTSRGAKKVEKAKLSRSVARTKAKPEVAVKVPKSAAKTILGLKAKEHARTVELMEPDLGTLTNSIKKSTFPRSISPMLSTLVDKPFTKEDWFFEPKLDGIRMIAFIKNGDVSLKSRNGLDLTAKFPDICQSLKSYTGNFILDGEAVVLDDSGKPSFQQLQQSAADLRYYVFDILYAADKVLYDLPLLQRKKVLEAVVRPDRIVKLVQSLGQDGDIAFEACFKNGLEGIVGKQVNSVYEPGKRTRQWLKVKTAQSSEFLICGYTKGTGARAHTFGSLLLGEHDANGVLRYVGGVGTGFSTAKLKALIARMRKLKTRKCPFEKRPRGKTNLTWIHPELVAEVKYMERTADRQLRAPVFMRLREDIEPADVAPPKVLHVESILERDSSERDNNKSRETRREKRKLSSQLSLDVNSVLEQLKQKRKDLTLEVGNAKLPVTNLDRIYWPASNGEEAVTKRDYIGYLARVSQYIIPHLSDRLLTLVRFPNGIYGGRFYQKHWEHKLPPGVMTAKVYTESENKNQDFIVCNNLLTLLWLGQIADLEIHTSHTRVVNTPDSPKLPEDMAGSVKKLEESVANYPDFMVLDLDPYLYSGKEKEGAEPELHRHGFELCREVALSLKEHLDRLRLRSFVKTSGKTGLHIYIPLVRNTDYDTVRKLSGIICHEINQERPTDTTMEWAVKNRTGKVFLDHNMNARSKSLASVYSLRVAPNAPVSTPIRWEELQHIFPSDFDIRTIPERLQTQGDIWKDILEQRNDLTELFKRPKIAL